MARALSQTDTRYVVKVDGNGDPTETVAEYRVSNGSLTEEPKAEVQATPNYNQTVNALWSGLCSGLNTAEGIV
jgi:hypothetical protein